MSDFISSDLSANEKNAWSTPQWLFDALHKEFAFCVDVAASADNKKCDAFIDKSQNALTMDNWGKSSHWLPALKNKAAWCNPPYARGQIKLFIKKAHQQCVDHKLTVVLLVPQTMDAGWWPDNATEIRVITHGRVSFEHPVSKKPINGNTKGSVVIIFKHADLDYPTITRYIKRDKLRALGIAAGSE